MLVGQGRFDLSTQGPFKYSLRHAGAKTIIVEMAPDGNGASAGTVAVYLGDASGAAPYFTVYAKTLRFYPSPDAEYVTLVPSAGARGLVTVSISQHYMGIGICPFESGGGAGATPAAHSVAITAPAGNDSGSVTTDTVIPGLSLSVTTLIGSVAAEYALAASLFWNQSRGDMQIRVTPYVDGVAAGTTIASTAGGVPYWMTYAAALAIPADGAAHTVDLRYQDQQNVGIIAFAQRSLSLTPATP
jgi:hypothetical protein